MSLKEALVLTIVMWEWLAANPDKEKEDHPEYASYEGLFAHCSLCEINSDGEDDLDCDPCPLDKAGHNCFKSNSFFDMFECQGKQVEGAQGIVDICKAALLEEA